MEESVINTYEMSYGNPNSHHLDISYFIDQLTGDFTQIQLPTWRPGRYELGNFAKNIIKFEVFSSAGEALPFKKLNSHLWEISLLGNSSIEVRYAYYAADLNAGSTYLGVDQLYVNPVNCLVYQPDRINAPCELILALPSDYTIATSLAIEADTILVAANYHELFDSPFIASNSLQTHKMFVNEVPFYLHFQGVCKPNFQQLEADFGKFASHQMAIFGDIPCEHYHFLFHLLPQSIHHGVEHQANTVIAMGPAYAQFSTAYAEFLGISSHELFHAWNIKAIRPAELHPYDYTKENYGNLGYVAEGVTTLMGDLTLWRSGVWSDSDFWTEFSKDCQKHFDNFGRFNYSVAQSAFDSWLDGYTSGVPNRKVSIYTEGMMYAFVLDVMICQKTAFKRSLYDVMYLLYTEHYKKGIGFTEEDYLAKLNLVAGHDFRPFFEQYIWKANDDFELIHDALKFVGIDLVVKPSGHAHEAKLGFKINSMGIVNSIYPNGKAEESGLWYDDKIIAINGIEPNGDAANWLEFFIEDEIELTIDRRHTLMGIKLKASDQEYYKWYGTRRSENNQENYSRWKNVKRTLSN